MRTKLLLVALLGFLFILPKSAQASLVTVEENGELSVNVLSAQDSIELQVPETDEIKIQNFVDDDPNPSYIKLTKSGGGLAVDISTNGENKILDVTNYEENIVEVVERPQVEKMFISAKDGKFIIKQKGILVTTDYEITINPSSAGVIVKTNSGYKFLSINPKTAVDSLLRTNLVSRLAYGESMELSEFEGELVYEIQGEKVFNIFDLLDYGVSVKTKISASTGELVAVDEPSWLGRIFSILV